MAVRASGPASAHAPGANSRVASADAVGVGPAPSTTSHCASAVSHASAGRRGARQVVGPGPHALAQLDHPQAGGRRRAARPARRPTASPALDDAEQPLAVPRRELGREAPVLRGLAAPQMARPARRRRRPRVSSPRSTMRLSATRAVPSATPNSAHHSTSRPRRHPRRAHAEQQAPDQRPGRQRPVEQLEPDARRRRLTFLCHLSRNVTSSS